MKSHRRFTTMMLLLSSLVLWTGCNALKRGDFLRSVDDSLQFSEIGFLVSDQLPGLLYRNALVSVKGNPDIIDIIVPYYQNDGVTPLVPDAATPLAVTFDIIPKDAVVDVDGIPISSGMPVEFHKAGSPWDRWFNITKTDPSTGEISSKAILVRVRKSIRP
ncbi:MAG: hypothetical protein RQ801_01895, partial [Spirochaetaceae bacterium]|nr:hypothetical protein [Spirochaetaceae bacterium]